MAIVSTDRYKALENFAQFMRSADSTVTNALRVFARQMRENAEAARNSFENAPDPEPAGPGKVSIAVTRDGYWHMAQMFDQNAAAAEKAADEIEEHLEKLMDLE